jgi:hypothetical protein
VDGVAAGFEHLYHTLDYVYDALKRVGLTNNSLTAGSLASIHRRSEAIANLADWFDVVSEPQEIEGIFQRAKQEKESGELIDLAQVE